MKVAGRTYANEVQFDIFEATVCSDELVCMARVCVHVSVGQGCAPIAEELHDLVDGLLVAGQEVPKHGSVFGVLIMVQSASSLSVKECFTYGLWVSLLRMNEGGELDTISDEEYWSVISD